MKELRLQYEIDPTFFLGMKLLPAFLPKKIGKESQDAFSRKRGPKRVSDNLIIHRQRLNDSLASFVCFMRQTRDVRVSGAFLTVPSAMIR